MNPVLHECMETKASPSCRAHAQVRSRPNEARELRVPQLEMFAANSRSTNETSTVLSHDARFLFINAYFSA